VKKNIFLGDKELLELAPIGALLFEAVKKALSLLL
jgi:hypothetical protein